MFNLFDHPWGLLTAAIIVLLGSLMFRRIFPEKQNPRQWLLPALLVAAAFAFDFLVETDTEKINALINTAVLAVEEENPDAIEPIISDDYRDSVHNTKSSLMSHCRIRLSEPLVEKNIERIVAMDISGPTATAIFTVRIIFDKQSYVYQSFKSQMLTKVKAHLRKQPDNRWLINRVELLEIDRRSTGWQDLKQQNW
jgi:hypothetical protein